LELAAQNENGRVFLYAHRGTCRNQNVSVCNTARTILKVKAKVARQNGAGL
jgi:hypothetical protein